MKYTYPRPQQVIAGTIFIMAETFDSKKYVLYEIEYHQGQNTVKRTFSHDEIQKMLDEGTATRNRKQTFANYKEFIKIPIYVK